MRILEAFSQSLKNQVAGIFGFPVYTKSTLLNPEELRNDLLYEDYAEDNGRTESLALYDEMDDNSPEFADALDSLSDLIIQGDDVHMNGFKTVTEPNGKTDTKTKLKPAKEDLLGINLIFDAVNPKEATKIEKILKDFEARTGIRHKMKYYVREALKYGDYFGNIIYGQTKESKQKVIAEILDIHPQCVMIHPDEYGRLSQTNPYELLTTKKTKDPIFYQQHEIFRLQIGGLADYKYGRSIGHSARKVYQQMVAIETGMVIGRLTRSHQRYLYKIDTTNMAPDTSLEYVNKVKRAMTKRKTVDKNGNLVYTKSPMTAEEDIYLPVKKGSGDDVQLLKSDEFLKNIDDVMYFRDKYKLALKTQTFGSSDSKGSRNAVAELDVQYVRALKGYQALVRYALEKLYNMELKLHKIETKVLVEMPEISSIMTMRAFDIERIKAEACKVYHESGVLSDEYLREYVLRLNDQELALENARAEQRKREEEAKAEKLAQSKTAASTAKASGENPQGGGSARTTTQYKNKRIKKSGNAYQTPRNATESVEQKSEE